MQTVEKEAVLYGNDTIETKTVHFWMENYKRKKRITLDIMEIGDKNVILEIPWFKKNNLKINWITGQIQWEKPLIFKGKPEKRISRNKRKV